MIIHLGLKWKLVINKKLMTEEHFHERRNFLSRKHKKMNWNQRWSTNLLETCNFVRYCKCVLIGVLGGGFLWKFISRRKGDKIYQFLFHFWPNFRALVKKLSANVLLQNTDLALTIINGFCRKEVGFLGMLFNVAVKCFILFGYCFLMHLYIMNIMI